MTADAVVLVGLAETAQILDALVDAGEGPRERAVYGTDGNLGERLGDLVEDRETLACMRGLLPVTRPDEALADRVRSHDPALAEVADAALDLAAESYDAVVLAALAAQAAGTDAGAAIAGAMAAVSDDGTTCREPGTCLDLLAAGADIAYVGQSGPIALDESGNRSDAGLTIDAVRSGVDALAPRPVVVLLNRFDQGDDLHLRNRDWLLQRDGFDVVVDVEGLAARLR